MKPIIASIEKGDKLYIVYQDLNKDYQIGEGIVTGFHHWTYTYGDRFEDYGTKPQTNILYEFGGISFSRNLENQEKQTYFRDSPQTMEKYDHLLGDRFVIVFTTYDEAKECIISMLNDYIDNNLKQIDDIQQKIDKYKNNLNNING